MALGCIAIRVESGCNEQSGFSSTDGRCTAQA